MPPHGRALVTGGAGFIGSHLTKSLTENHETVHVLDNLSSGTRDNVPDGTTLVTADVTDTETLTDLVADVDVVYHQAAIASVARSTENPTRTHHTNVAGTLTVLETARTHEVPVVAASSAAIYGHPTELPVPEDHPTTPTSPYGLEKLALDHYARLYHDLYDLPTVALRYFNVYGPGQTGGDYAGVISVFIEQALNDEPITVHGDGTQTRDFVSVDDVVRANRRAARAVANDTPNAVGRAFNVGTGESISIFELAELIREITDTTADIVTTAPRPGDIEHSRADVSRARDALEFEAQVDVKTGLERTVEWFREQRESSSRGL